VVALLALVTVLVTVLVMVFCSWGAVGVLLLLLVLQSKAALGMGLTVFRACALMLLGSGTAALTVSWACGAAVAFLGLTLGLVVLMAS